ncbi:MAG: peptide deformylase [Chloroflexota bacterium]
MMAVRKVIYVDDDRLRQKAKKVKNFTAGLKQLAQDMLETMRSYQGVGLAGPQIGVMQRLFVAEIPAGRGDGAEPHPQSGRSYVLINPEIVKTSAELVEGQEGCLSIPNWQGLVERPQWLEIKAQDVNGRKIKLKVDDYLARIFSHEVDHLNGVLFTDHIKDPAKLWPVENGEPAALE